MKRMTILIAAFGAAAHAETAIAMQMGGVGEYSDIPLGTQELASNWIVPDFRAGDRTRTTLHVIARYASPLFDYCVERKMPAPEVLWRKNCELQGVKAKGEPGIGYVAFRAMIELLYPLLDPEEDAEGDTPEPKKLPGQGFPRGFGMTHQGQRIWEGDGHTQDTPQAAANDAQSDELTVPATDQKNEDNKTVVPTGGLDGKAGETQVAEEGEKATDKNAAPGADEKTEGEGLAGTAGGAVATTLEGGATDPAKVVPASKGGRTRKSAAKPSSKR